MKNALIGYTGFVGSNLARQKEFNSLYNSKNYQDMNGQYFDEIYCAGVSAVKWQAIKEPEIDKANIKKLQDVLKTVKADRFVLISTIDVYPLIKDKDETFNCHSINNHSYGAHRLLFEDFCKEHFPNCFIIRLPALFGPGLKKNVIYDLLNNNCLDMINPASSFQYYYLNNLRVDIQKAVTADIKLINLFTEPVSTGTIIDNFFQGKQVGKNPAAECHYDLHTCHSAIWQMSRPYIYSQKQVLSQMKEFIDIR